jgi:hypothetical protein
VTDQGVPVLPGAPKNLLDQVDGIFSVSDVKICDREQVATSLAVPGGKSNLGVIRDGVRNHWLI